MTQYNSVNVNSSDSHIKISNKSETGLTLRISSSMIRNPNDESNFQHNLLLNNRQAANICKTFTNNSSFNIKLSKTQRSKITQRVNFLVDVLGHY